MASLPRLKPMTFFERVQLIALYCGYLLVLYVWHEEDRYAVAGIGLAVLVLWPFVYVAKRIQGASPDPALTPKDQLVQQIVLACDGHSERYLRLMLRLLGDEVKPS